jgi:outer membrane protein assembly factor BamB
MQSYPHIRRWLAGAITVVVFGLIIAVAIRPAGSLPIYADQPKEDAPKIWPLFGGNLQRNMVNLVDKNVPTTWSVEKGQEKNIKWVADLGSRAYGGPVIAKGRIFVGTNNELPRNPAIKGDKGIVMCFDEATGRFLWQSVHDKLAAGMVHDWPREGICSTPMVDGNRVYYVSNRCEVVCADMDGLHAGKNLGVQDEKYTSDKDADIIWRLDMMKELNVFPHNLATSSPLIVGDLLYVVTSNGVDEQHINIPVPKAPSFIAVNKNTGKVVWTDNSPGLRIIHGQWSNPTYAVVNGEPQIIFPGGDGWVRAFVPDTGKLIWEFDCNPKDVKYKLGGGGKRSEIIATPVVHDNKCYIGVGQDPEHGEGIGHLWCIDITKKGDISLEVVTDPNSDPVKSEPNKNSGAVWHFGGATPPGSARDYFFGRTMSTCAVVDGLCYAAELAGYLHCLDANTGKLYWTHDLKGAVWGSPYWVDGKIYIGMADDGDVYIFQHGKEDKLINTVENKHGVKSTPVVVNGVLYIMTETNLYAIKQQ